MAPVVRALKNRPGAEVIVCVTGQHREMLSPILKFFEIVPDIDLGLMRPDQTLASLTARLIESLDEVIRRTAPQWVIAQGDTTSVMAGAISAFYRKVPFAHVEAGLRTGAFNAPFPEEFHRRVADLTASLHFAPTAAARNQLIAEGVSPDQVILSGNTVVDALLQAVSHEPDWSAGPLASVDRRLPIVLVTAHRRESFGEPIREICSAIKHLSDKFRDRQIQWVFPVHMNPHVHGPVHEMLGGQPGVFLTEPLDYPWLVQVLKHARLVLTDSGGIQEEAPSLGVPVLVMRTTTERPEAVEAGLSKLVGAHAEDIIRETVAELGRGVCNQKTGTLHFNPYGDGKAADRIANALTGIDPALFS
jgi:UDP-N-acetylglucosamine 2-epimerase